MFPSSMIHRVRYISNLSDQAYDFERFTNVVFIRLSSEFMCPTYHTVFYRPALLNHRHLVDVVRAVCEEPVVSDEDLDDAKCMAMNYAWDLGLEDGRSKGIWRTCWLATLAYKEIETIETIETIKTIYFAHLTS